MRGYTVIKAAAASAGLALLLGAPAQAQVDDASSGGVNARAVAASQRAYQLRDRVEAALRREGPAAQVMSLAMAPAAEGGRLCGIAHLGESRYGLFQVGDAYNPEGSLSLTPIAGTLNGLAVAHNDVYAQCGGVGRAVFIVDHREVIG